MTEIVVRVVDCHIFRWENGKPLYLLLKRSESQMYPGIWQCVTGKIEADERPHEAAIRELKEETGFMPNSMWTVDQVNHFFEAEQNRMNLIPVFGVEVDSSNITLSPEHTEYKWCSVDEGADLMLWNQQKQGLLNFHRMITNEPEKLYLSRI
ncbi:MAG: NUDIX pyrophosphatase [Candidatus Marinimicrobia bacterium]|nr:NUDIX pyrophosphatase [Candidatus Neomarinimicrobiota bacterium]